MERVVKKKVEEEKEEAKGEGKERRERAAQIFAKTVTRNFSKE